MIPGVGQGLPGTLGSLRGHRSYKETQGAPGPVMLPPRDWSSCRPTSLGIPPRTPKAWVVAWGQDSRPGRSFLRSGPFRQQERQARCPGRAVDGRPSRTWTDGNTHTHTHTHTEPGTLFLPRPHPSQEQVALSAAGWGWPHTCPFVHHVPGHCPGVQSPCGVCPGRGRSRGRGATCREVQPGCWCGEWRSGLVGHQGDQSAQQGQQCFISLPGVVGDQPQASPGPWGSRADLGSPRLLTAG